MRNTILTIKHLIICMLLLISNNMQADYSIPYTFPSTIYNNNIIYFQEFNGNLIIHNLKDGTYSTKLSLPGLESAFELMTRDPKLVSDPFTYVPKQILVSPTHTGILALIPNTNRFNSSFYSQNSSNENLWWLYSNEEWVPLDERFTSVSWFSDNEIIYVFDNKELAVTNIEDLKSFKSLEDNIPSPFNMEEVIVANKDNQLIPLTGGYLLGKGSQFKFYPTEGLIETLPSNEFLVGYSENEFEVINWEGDIISKVTDFVNISKAFLINKDNVLVLLQNGELILYNMNTKQYSNIYKSDQSILDVLYANYDNPTEILILQAEASFVYNVIEQQTESILFGDNLLEDTQNGNSNQTNILIVFFIILLGIAVFLFVAYKLRYKST